MDILQISWTPDRFEEKYKRLLSRDQHGASRSERPLVSLRMESPVGRIVYRSASSSNTRTNAISRPSGDQRGRPAKPPVVKVIWLGSEPVAHRE
jgi:hypothetical protein